MYYQLQECLNHRAKTEAGKSILAFLVSYPQAQSSLQRPWPISRRQREERGSSEAEKGDPQMGRGWRSVASRCLAVWGALVGPQRRTYDGAQGRPALPEQSRDHVGRPSGSLWTVGALRPCERGEASLSRSHISSSSWFYPGMGTSNVWPARLAGSRE